MTIIPIRPNSSGDSIRARKIPKIIPCPWLRRLSRELQKKPLIVFRFNSLSATQFLSFTVNISKIKQKKEFELQGAFLGVIKITYLYPGKELI
jgi:hypothetical protein